ncbi:MAG: hypothetical protein ACFFAN_03825 [Promethearchaeota archaeon]
MTETFSLEKILNNIATGNLNKITAAEILISFIENCNDIGTRVKSLEILEKINLKNEYIFKILENLLISDENAAVRVTAFKILIHNFPEKGKVPLKWAILHEQSFICLMSYLCY